MGIYLLKFSGCLLVFWLLYVLLLEKQKMHNVKRFYLLLAFLLALTIPLTTVTHYVEPLTLTKSIAQNEPIIPPILSTEVVTLKAQPTNYLPEVLWSVYSVGVLLFFARFVVNLRKLYQRIYRNPTLKQRPYIYVLLEQCPIPHSFFNYLFFSKSKFETGNFPKEVILHEETHAKQLHSVDILLVELLQIVLWFHPLLYILKHHIKLNHEFLADQAVLEQGADTKNYQHILLQFSSSSPEHQLVSAINYSSIKKRFTLMKTQTSKTKIWTTTLLILPITVLLFYSFSSKEYTEKEEITAMEAITQEITQNQVSQKKTANGASEKLMLEYRAFIKKHQKTNTIYVNEYKRAVLIYNKLMTDEQRASVEKYPERELLETNLANVAPKKLTKGQFEAFKNEEVYAMWIDGKHVPNSELDQYSYADFVHYSGSKVYKNARSKKFPQAYQYRLFTKNGFKNTFLESRINEYKQAVDRYSKALSIYTQGNQNDNSELKILKYQADEIYNSLSNSEISNYNIRPTAPIPDENSTSAIIKGDSIKFLKDWFIDIDGKKYYYLYDKNKGWKYYNSNKKAVSLDIVSEYKKKHNILKKLTKTGKHYVEKSKNEQQIMDMQFSDLGGMYFRMTKTDKAKVERPVSHVKPYVKITLNGKTYYKKYAELTSEEKATLPQFPPAPPAPEVPTSLSEKEEAAIIIQKIIEEQDPYDVVNTGIRINTKGKKVVFPENTHVYIRNSGSSPKTPSGLVDHLASDDLKNAQFYFEGEKISSKKGLELIKNKKDIKIETLPYKNKQPEVRIYKSESKGTIPPPPSAPKVVKRKLSDSPPPPLPPKPVSPLDHVIAMAKKDAQFLYEGKEISSDKAIKLLKNNKDLNIDSRASKGKRPVVKISASPIEIE